MRTILLLLACLAAACASPTAYVGRPEAELRALGTRTGEYPAADGSRIVAYSPGVFSGLSYLARVDASGTVREVRQGLVEENFERIQPGMRGDEVLRLIGPPVDSMRFPRKREVSWEYRFMDAWGYRALFFVNLDERGVVVGKFTRRIENDRLPIR